MRGRRNGEGEVQEQEGNDNAGLAKTILHVGKRPRESVFMTQNVLMGGLCHQGRGLVNSRGDFGSELADSKLMIAGI